MIIEVGLQNLTNVTRTATSYNDLVTEPSDHHNTMRRTLSYAVPLSCLAVALIVLIVFGIRRRRRILEKWNSMKRMKNTNPRFHQSTGLRRDSEFDSFSRQDIQSSSKNEENIREYPLTTVF